MAHRSQSNAISARALLKKLLALKSSVEFTEFQIDLSRLYLVIVLHILCRFALEMEKHILQLVLQNVQDFTRLNMNLDRVKARTHVNVTIVLKELFAFQVEMFVCRICTIHVLNIDVVS
jgi:hypothetical protein